MKIEHCLRCNSKKLERGVIYEYASNSFPSPMRVHWKLAPHIRADSAPITAIVCKSCGHIELTILKYENIDPIQYKCPHCKAIYYYKLPLEEDTPSVECQNCGKVFQIEDSKEFEDVFDEIEKDLQKE